MLREALVEWDPHGYVYNFVIHCCNFQIQNSKLKRTLICRQCTVLTENIRRIILPGRQWGWGVIIEYESMLSVICCFITLESLTVKNRFHNSVFGYQLMIILSWYIACRERKLIVIYNCLCAETFQMGEKWMEVLHQMTKQVCFPVKLTDDLWPGLFVTCL